MAGGVVAVVLCLVLAMVALVASIGRTNVTSVASTKNMRSSYPGMISGHSRVGRTIAVFHGTGAGTRGPFTVRAPGDFGVAWKYRCVAGRLDEFAVGDTDAEPGAGSDLDVNSSGSAGQGVSWVSGDAGRHHLIVVSDCGWDIRVVLPRRS